MPPRLKQYLNRSVLVSIPALFEDGICRAHTLQSIENDGLWLSSHELVARLLPKHDREPARVPQPIFIPATHIAAIILPPPAASTAEVGNATAAAAASSQTATAGKPAAPKRGKTAAAPAASPQAAQTTRQK